MIRFKAYWYKTLRNPSSNENEVKRTWEMDPNVIRVENLELADYVTVSSTVGTR
jgi:hypothetical protein